MRAGSITTAVLAALAWGCGDGAAGESTVLRGHIEGLALGPGSSIEVRVSPVGLQGLLPGPVLAHGDIDGEGNFQVTLPGTREVERFLGTLEHAHTIHEGCTADIHTEPTPLRLGLLLLSITNGPTRRLIQQVVSRSSTKAGSQALVLSHYFTPSEGSAVGSSVCMHEGERSSLTYRWILHPGWNTTLDAYRYSAIGPQGPTSDVELTTGPVPLETRWSLR